MSISRRDKSTRPSVNRKKEGCVCVINDLINDVGKTIETSRPYKFVENLANVGMPSLIKSERNNFHHDSTSIDMVSFIERQTKGVENQRTLLEPSVCLKVVAVDVVNELV
jgi:hypothetical protein